MRSEYLNVFATSMSSMRRHLVASQVFYVDHIMKLDAVVLRFEHYYPVVLQHQEAKPLS